tara:strand:- start:74 stop:364 length:291 start_codon:yes stop_codon:yes gene_type:complete
LDRIFEGKEAVFHLFDRIVTSFAQGITPHDTPEPFQTADKDAFLLNRLDAVFGTAWSKPASRRQNWPDKLLVATNTKDGHATHLITLGLINFILRL